MEVTDSHEMLQLLEVRIVATVSARPGLSAVELCRVLGVGGLTELLAQLVNEQRVYRTGVGQEATYFADESLVPPPVSRRRKVEPMLPGVQRVVRRRRIVTV